jgi:hypothetical protein
MKNLLHFIAFSFALVQSSQSFARDLTTCTMHSEPFHQFELFYYSGTFLPIYAIQFHPEGKKKDGLNGCSANRVGDVYTCYNSGLTITMQGASQAIVKDPREDTVLPEGAVRDIFSGTYSCVTVQSR